VGRSCSLEIREFNENMYLAEKILVDAPKTSNGNLSNFLILLNCVIILQLCVWGGEGRMPDMACGRNI
jgi:hypothetical protein